MNESTFLRSQKTTNATQTNSEDGPVDLQLNNCVGSILCWVGQMLSHLGGTDGEKNWTMG